MEGSELFRHAENWLNSNPGKTLADYRKETGYTGPALKTRQRRGEPVRISYKGKSTQAQQVRSQREKPKTEGEAAYARSTKRAAKQRSESTLHQHAYQGKPSVAEHNVRLASGGTNEQMSVSDPDFKVFKDTVESKLPKGYVADIDDVSGGVRVIPEKFHNKYQPTSKQPGVTLNQGDNITATLRNMTLQQAKPAKPKPMKPKTPKSSPMVSMTRNGVLGGETHPMGGSVVNTDPIFGMGLPMRLP